MELPTLCSVCGSESNLYPHLGIFSIHDKLWADTFHKSDICDRKVDGLVARTKGRPLPSGMITYPEAMAAFIIGVLLSVAVTDVLLGHDVTITMLPIWLLSFIYPFGKRKIWAPQVILGLTMASCVLPPWIALGNDWSNLSLPGSLFGVVFCWLVYIDLIYASQVSNNKVPIAISRLIITRIVPMTRRLASNLSPSVWVTI